MLSRKVTFFIFVHMVISLIGLLRHVKLHPVDQSLYFWWASPINVISLFVLPCLFARPATVAWGYLLNSFIVAIGTIGMAYFTLLSFEGPLTPQKILFASTLPYILILWLKVPLATSILREMRS